MGARYPYDAPDAWWDADLRGPCPAKDWAHAAARGVIDDLCDRNGIKNQFNQVDQDVRVEIVSSLATIIREAAKSEPWWRRLWRVFRP